MRKALVLAALIVAFVLVAGAAWAVLPGAPYGSNADCLACHGVASGGPALSKVDFSAPVSELRCNACHLMAPDQAIHDKVVASPKCSMCHGKYNADTTRVGQYTSPVSGSRFSSPASLLTSAAELHRIHANAGWMTLSATSGITTQWCKNCHLAAACDACHGPATSHTAHVGPQPSAVASYAAVTGERAWGSGGAPDVTRANTYGVIQITCEASACHPKAALVAGASVPACASCHPAKTSDHGYASIDHVADATATVDASGKACADCHSMDLYTEHQRTLSSSKAAGCAACHPSPRNTFAAWDQTCSQGGCHASGSTTEKHGAMAAKHVPAARAAKCAECHPGDLAGAHAAVISRDDPSRSSCTICHATDRRPVTNDCTVCHFPYEGHYNTVKHTSVWTLTGCEGAGCHSTRDLMGVHTEKNAAFKCYDCHGSARPEVQAAIAARDTACGSCHTGVTATDGHRAAHWASPQLIESGQSRYAYYTGSAPSGVFTSDCAQCHTSNVIDEHLGVIDPTTGIVARRPRFDNTGAALSCATCHGSLDAGVMNAIATRATNCDACHVTHGPIADTHRSSFATDTSVACGQCHDSDLSAQHSTFATTTPSGRLVAGCALCHEYWESERGQQIEGAIASGATQCAACHTGGHPDFASHTATSAASQACAVCHTAGGATSIDVKTLHAGAGIGPCAVCHANSARVATIAVKTAECVSCHAVEGTDHHRNMTVKHTNSAMAADCTMSGCHASNQLPQAHEPYLSRFPQYATVCALCHAHADPGRIPAGATAACGSCHTVHGDLNALHAAPDSAECVACHESADVRAVHAGSAKGACAVCHDNPAVAVLPTSAKCANCHGALSPADPNHYPAGAHAAVDATLEPGVACSQCHGLDMRTEHFKASSGAVTCAQCHENKVDSLTGAWDKTCAQCHAAKHDQAATKHQSTKTACGGTGCHAISDVSAIHAAKPGHGCALCHTTPDALPVTTDCGAAGCHANVTGNHEAKHDLTSVVDGGCFGCHLTSLTSEHAKLGYTCATCHSSAKAAVAAAIAGHDRTCEACHPAVNGRNKHAAQDTLEFVAGNSGGHRVSADLPWMQTKFSIGGATYTWTAPAASAFLKTGRTTSSVVACSDCHNFGTDPAGPHGSTVTVRMDPAYTGDYGTAYLSNSGISSSTVICAKCHTNFRGMNNVHSAGDHDNKKCVLCHSQVPHGWRLPRLLAYVGDPAPYGTISGGISAINLGNHTPTGWTESNCTAGCGGGDHSAVPSSVWPSKTIAYGAVGGLVTDSSGSPLAGVTVSASTDGTTTTDATGRYAITRLVAGSVSLTFSKTGYTTQTKTATIAASQSTSVDVTLVPTTGALTGRVVDAASSSALSGVTVTVAGATSTTTNSNGDYAFASITNGTYSVTFSKSGYTSQTKTVTISGGQSTKADVALAAVPVNLALNKTFSASRYASSYYLPGKAGDGSTSSYWWSQQYGSSYATEWLQVDLGSSKSVSKAVVTWYGSLWASEYRVYASLDGSSWTQLYSTSSGTSAKQTVTFTSRSARYIRVECRRTGSGSNGYGISELEVY